MTRAGRPPGRDAQSRPVIPPGGPHRARPSPSQQGTDAASLGSVADDGRDLDAALSVIHSSADSLGPWLAIWSARTEPDAHARRCASDAIDAIDATLCALHRIRARLISETRQADDRAMDRAGELLARLREEPS
jgi:hypothetical protein